MAKKTQCAGDVGRVVSDMRDLHRVEFSSVMCESWVEGVKKMWSHKMHKPGAYPLTDVEVLEMIKPLKRGETKKTWI